MRSDRQPYNSQYVIATFKTPTLWHRTEDECWLLNPLRRHILQSDHLAAVNDFVESISDLKGSSYYTPLIAGKSLASSRVLIERNRDRGIGDLLFLTGPLNFMQHVSGNNVKIDVYSLADRGAVLTHHPALHLGTTLHGPLFYDDLGLYNYQWMIETVTECNEEPDQLNVYDALYQQLGFDPRRDRAKVQAAHRALWWTKTCGASTSFFITSGNTRKWIFAASATTSSRPSPPQRSGR
jgi:hypothetical protein